MKQFRSYPHTYGKVKSLYLISDARYGSSDKDDYFTRISKTPDIKFYLNFDLKDYNDPEFEVYDLYHIGQSNSSWSPALINNIKYHMTSIPPLYNWDKMNKVSY